MASITASASPSVRPRSAWSNRRTRFAPSPTKAAGRRCVSAEANGRARRSIEGERIEDQAVETLPNNGRTNRAGPEIFAIRPDFHPGHHEAVGELPGPESCHRGQYDARHLSEHGFISALPAPVLRRRQLHRSEEPTSELQSLMRNSY